MASPSVDETDATAVIETQVRCPSPQSDQTGRPVLQVHGLTTDFVGSGWPVRVLDHVSLSLHQGETLGVVGESGSGKSVLLRSIMGVLRPGVAEISGSVELEGQQLVGMRRQQLRRLWGNEVSIVFQDPMTSLNPVVRIGRQIGETVKRQPGMGAGDAKARSVELLRAVGLSEPERKLRLYPHELSGGMRQRVAIAIALAGNPKLLLADEPTTALDVTVQAQILDLLGTLQEERNMAVIIVSHDLGLLANRAHRIAVMYAGQVVEEAPTAEILEHRRAPYSEALLRAVPRLDQPSHRRLYTIAGGPPDLAKPQIGCRFAARCTYVQDRCRHEEPALQDDASPNHRYRCWYPVGERGVGATTNEGGSERERDG
jgi:oligopeptide/dipeptide ABC transporter ATP-binding protein